MSKNTLKILPIGGVVFPYQNIKLLIPPNSTFFGIVTFFSTNFKAKT
jgi:hypothetical protein